MPTSNRHPALALKLGRGGKQGAAVEIVDTTTGRPVALILDGAHAETLTQCVVALPNLVWGVLRAAAHLNCDDPAVRSTPETRKICKLLREVIIEATSTSPTK